MSRKERKEMARKYPVAMQNFMHLAVGAFLVAALTGVLLRFGLYLGMPAWAQNFTAVRHAHSHLMYFGWATLAIMAMIWHQLPRWTQTPLPRAVGWQMAVTALAALLSFPAFWRNGYGLTQIGPAALPLGSIVAGWNGIMWILFALCYRRATAHLTQRPLPVQLWDWAILLLLLAWVGAFGLVPLVILESTSLFLQQMLLHLFLDLFAVGWFTLALLGLLWSWIGQQQPLPRWLPTRSLALCLAPTFFLGVSPLLVPTPLFWISALANLGAAVGLAWHLGALWQRRSSLPVLVRFGLVALGLHLLIALPLLWPGLWQWSAGTPLRIFYLHNLLLGWISSGLLGLGLALWFPLAQPWRWAIHGSWIGGVTLLLLALLGLVLGTQVAAIPGRFWLQLAAWSSVLVAASVGGIAVYGLWARRKTHEPSLDTPVFDTTAKTPHPG
jgi:hypothetical protein